MTESRSFAINGRFLTQAMTGVQRYAMNVTRGIGQEIHERGETVTLLAPKTATDPKFNGIHFETVSGSRGQVWEQIVLPRAWPGVLLNLCNTAPALKKEQVICIHDANVFLAPESYGASFRLFYKSLQPLLVSRATRIATVSKFSAEQIAKYFSLEIRDIAVLPNGHEHVHTWDPRRAVLAPAALRLTPDGEERPFVLALGSRARHKNLGLLLSLANDLALLNVDLVVAGGQADIFASEALQRSENVQHLGFITDHDLAYLLERALCLAFPSLTEGFGLPVLEAMALGCPVVSTDRASLPDICGNAALLAPPDQPHRWLEHVQVLLKNPSLREDLIAKGRSQALLFSWTDTAKGYMDLMLSPQRRRSAPPLPLKSPPKVAVVIATLGRPETVSQTLRRIIERQTYRPAAVIISCTKFEDAGAAASWPEVTLITGRPGLAAQRNTALAMLPETIEIVSFFDDDFVPEATWLEVAVRLFQENPDIVGLTGDVIADGIKGPGLSFADTDRLIDQASAEKASALIEPYSPYGCNMAFRRSAIGTVRFDERLVLYGWLEDRDFGAALGAKGGRLVKCIEARGVHMGVKSGRIAGDRLGYSQIINPLYLLRKGTMTRSQVFGQVSRNVIANIVGSILPEDFVDRRGRLRGNFRGASDALRGYLDPERALCVRGKEVN